MKKRKTMSIGQRLLIISMGLIMAITAQAEQKIRFHDYEVHYMGLTSSELKAEVAKLYGIPRSRSLGYLNISVLKTKDEVLPKPSDAQLSGKIYNLMGQSRTLEFKRIQEADAVYFVTTFDFDDGDLYRFEIEATPTGSGEPLAVQFSQRFYEDN